MKNIKDELQNIILRDGPIGSSSKLKQVQNFLRRNACSGKRSEKQEYFKSEEEKCLIDFAVEHALFYLDEIDESMFISEGAEQRVYKFDDFNVIKLNSSIFYEYWLDYFNNLLIHNFFFSSTKYDFLGFKIIDGQLYAIVKQQFILANETTNLQLVRSFLEYNSFRNTRNNDYVNSDLCLIFEDLHDENVLTKDGILYFIDTVFYLSKNFSSSE
ncbi:hypothetical protein [Sphingobacterium prati]|uniref:putative polyvalent protein kinase domain-containing protein n=1 Tax=Sphingobacterium prati TaxID=2737006 RepID=UPI001554F981|nr:hypothetical protein [Sphingobacterium prati]NPE46746.1 hypothetical protein [Sphingobacterium prati]